MMEHDPERLVKGADSGSARELLLAARSEEAPRAVRERVLSTIAAAFARARADAASVPASKLSGVFERFEGGSSKLPQLPQSALTLLQRRPSLERRAGLERIAVDPLDAEPIELFRRSRRNELTPVVRRTPIALQLGAAVLVGVLVATGAHYMGGRTPSAARVSRAEDGVRRSTPLPKAERMAVSPPAEGTRAAMSSGAMSSGAMSSGATLSSGASLSPRGEAAEAEASPDADIASPRSALGVAAMGAPSGRSCAGACPSPDSAAPARTTARAAFDELAGEHPGGFSEDWLGEQLALVSRAERSLAEGNPAEAIRSLDEYQARFPKGLLDLQIGALRKIAERTSSIADVSEAPRAN